MLEFLCMKFTRIGIILFLILILTGCSSIKGLMPFSKKTSVPPAEKISAPAKPENSIGKVVNKDLFAKGGELVVIPFSAGSGVVSDKELDRIALMIVKGIADGLQESPGSRFKIDFAEEVQYASAIMEGHITKKQRLSFLKKWFFLKKRKALAIKAEITDRDSQDLIAVVDGELKSKKDSFKEMAYILGVEIARFLSQNN